MSSHSPLRRTSRRSGSGSRMLQRLLVEGRGVGLDLLVGEQRAQRRAPGGIADARGVVADDQHDAVTGVLELAQLAQHDRVAEVDVGRGRVDPELHAQRTTRGVGRSRASAASAPGGQAVDRVASERGGLVGGARHRGSANARLSPPVELATLPSGSRSRLKKLRFFLIFLALLLLGLVSFAFGMFMAVASDLPGLENQQQYNNARNSVLLDDRGREIGVLSRQNQILVTPQQIPPIVKEAVISIEDKRFMTNSGVDLRSIARAFVDDLLHQGAVQGASTIEQQFVKNALQEQAHRTSSRSCARPRWPFTWPTSGPRKRSSPSTSTRSTSATAPTGSRPRRRRTSATKSTIWAAGPPNSGCASKSSSPGRRRCSRASSSRRPTTTPSRIRRRRANGATSCWRRCSSRATSRKPVYETSVMEPLPAAQDIASPNQPLIDGIDTGYFDAWVGQQVIDRYHAGPTYDGGLQIKTTLDLELQRAAEQASTATWPTPKAPARRSWRSKTRPARSARWWAGATSTKRPSTSRPRASASRARPSRPSISRPRWRTASHRTRCGPPSRRPSTSTAKCSWSTTTKTRTPARTR